MNVQVLAKAEVLGCPVDGGYIKVENKDYWIFYGKAEPGREMSFKYLLGELGNLVPGLTESEIKGALPDKFSEAKFLLKEVYFIKTTDKDSEFAFWFDIDLDEFTKGWPISVKSISVKLWATQNNKILEEMNINSMQELLKLAEKSNA